jgi:hypothetical protein
MISAKLVSLIWLAIAWGLCNGQPPLLSQQQPVPPDTVITLERPGCFLGCQAYLLTISADGTVTFEGSANVRVKGKVQGQISHEKVQLLVAAFLKAKFFSLRDRYAGKQDGCRQIWVDSDSAITSIVMNGKSKSVSHYLGCHQNSEISYPKALTELERKIDEVANTKQWLE